MPEWRTPPPEPALRELEVHIWYSDFTRLACRLEALKCLSDAERARAQQFKSERSGRAYRLSHAFLRNVLSRYLNLNPSNIPFESVDRGKPRLTELDGQSLQFNLSRCRSGVICAVALGSSVGIDLEELNPDLCEDSTAEQLFTASEMRQLRVLDGERRIRAFFRGWTRKEAYSKCTGRGLSSELKSMTVGLEDTSAAVGSCFLATFACPGGEIASIAIAAAPVEIRFWCIAG